MLESYKLWWSQKVVSAWWKSWDAMRRVKLRRALLHLILALQLQPPVRHWVAALQAAKQQAQEEKEEEERIRAMLERERQRVAELARIEEERVQQEERVRLESGKLRAIHRDRAAQIGRQERPNELGGE